MIRAKTITLTVFLFFFAANTPCSACWDDYDDDWYDYWDDDDWWENDWDDDDDDYAWWLDLPEVEITPEHDDWWYDDDDWWRSDDDDDSGVDDDDFEDFDCVDSYNSQDENNNQLTCESHKEMVLKWVASFNKELKALIDKLSKEQKIKIMERKDNIIVKTPKYDPKDGVIILPMTTNYGAESLTHEVIHYLQDMLKNLNYSISSTNNEYQAYVLNYFLNSADGGFATQPHMISPDMWSDFVNNNKGHYGKDDSGFYWYDNTFISRLENLNHDSLVHSFADYYREINGPEGYYKHINPNYSWNWSVLLERLGFKKK